MTNSVRPAGDVKAIPAARTGCAVCWFGMVGLNRKGPRGAGLVAGVAGYSNPEAAPFDPLRARCSGTHDPRIDGRGIDHVGRQRARYVLRLERHTLVGGEKVHRNVRSIIPHLR